MARGHYGPERILQFSIELKAAHKTVRRGSDLTVGARLTGFTATKANLWIRYSGTSDWRPGSMLPEPGGAAFGFQFLANLRTSADYYVEAEGIRSQVARLKVIDLPGVRNITVTYSPETKEGPASSNGDIIAPSGTVASLAIETDRPMNGGELVLEEADPIDLSLDARTIRLQPA